VVILHPFLELAEVPETSPDKETVVPVENSVALDALPAKPPGAVILPVEGLIVTCLLVLLANLTPSVS